MHDSVMEWASEVIVVDDIKDRDILEVGSYNVNGSVRGLVERFSPSSYLGVDRSAGPGVDRVVDCEKLTEVLGRDCADVVVSTEMLEHCSDWQRCVYELVAAVRPGGVLVVTTRSIGFPYHCPPDVWRYTLDSLVEAFRERAGLTVESASIDPDPERPGVFLKVRKPAEWVGWITDLHFIAGVTRMVH